MAQDDERVPDGTGLSQAEPQEGLGPSGFDPSRDDGGWHPIEVAPKDGTLILLTAIEEDGTLFEVWPMQWMHIQRNALFPDVTGMWTSPFGGLTWNGEPGDGGPTHWRERGPKASPTPNPMSLDAKE